jgi:5-oxoprolinase (ATP-hydrolysing)
VRAASRAGAQIGAATGEPRRRRKQVAEGFIQIAVGNMANAIKQISVQRGHDVTGYTLTSFGGAGGQHACLVADALGMKTVFIHSLAGVLSAYGMGLADQRRDARARGRAPPGRSARRRTGGELDELGARRAPNCWPRACRPSASNCCAACTCATKAPIRPSWWPSTARGHAAGFEDAYRRRFSFLMPGKALVVEAVSVEALGRSDAPPSSRALRSRASPAPAPHERARCSPAAPGATPAVYLRAGIRRATP